MDSEPSNPDEVAHAARESPSAAEGGDPEARPRKRPRIGGGGLKRVAEVVLVLATMARVRAGKKPTEAEVGLMAEAREKLAELCGGLAPKDIVTREAIGAVIEDLGLNARAKEQKLGFRGPRLTIAERFSQWERKVWLQFCYSETMFSC